MSDKSLCPDCFALATLHDPFPADAYVAPCLEHIVGSAYCMDCGDALDNHLKYRRCMIEQITDWADSMRKEE